MLEETFKNKVTERAIEGFKNAVLKQAMGNYTKAYETWKRIYNVVNSFLEEIRNSSKKEIRVLDLGCGDGYHILLLNTLKEIQAKKITFEGIDISNTNVMFANQVAKRLGFKNVNFIQGNIEQLDFPLFSFDVILCTDVIEHIVNPEKFIESLSCSLKAGGLAIVTTPNKSNAIVRLYQTLTGRKKNPQTNTYEQEDKYAEEGHGHISVKSLDEWTELFRGKGLLVEKIKRGSVIFGGPCYNPHTIFFSIMLVLDKIFDYLGFMKNFSEAHTYLIRKSSKLG